MSHRAPMRLVLASAVLLAACGGGTQAGNSDDTGGDSAQGPVVAVTGTDGLAFQPEEVTASTGSVTFELTSEPSVAHTLAIEGVNSNEPIVTAEAGQTATGTTTLEQGTYTFFCDVPGHREAGMEGTLIVG